MLPAQHHETPLSRDSSLQLPPSWEADTWGQLLINKQYLAGFLIGRPRRVVDVTSSVDSLTSSTLVLIAYEPLFWLFLRN